MWIKWDNTNCHAMGSIDGKEIFSLSPGWNDFPKRIWDENKDHPEILGFLEDKTIELLDEKKIVLNGKKKTVVSIGMDDEPLNLKDLSDGKALTIIKDTYKQDILNRWFDEDNRHKIKKAITARLKDLMPKEN